MSEVLGVKLTHPDRVLYPEQGISKLELARYYERVADWMLPYVADRPLSVVRCPQGRQKQCFYQKHLQESFPDPVQGIEIQERTKKATYLRIRDAGGLIALVQMGVLEIHPWGARADRIERPDWMIFDIDPSPNRSWTEVVEAARLLGEKLDELGLTSFVRTTGGKGLHVCVPLTRRSDWEEVKNFAHAVSKLIVRREPDRYVATMSKDKRKGKIFIDYLRNSRGSTAVASYSTRSHAGAPVATPIAWDELDSVSGASAFHVGNVPERLAALKKDPWDGFFDIRQSITAEIKKRLDV